MSTHYEEHRLLGYRIRYYRQIRKLTQEQLSVIVDKNANYIATIESSKSKRSLSLNALFDIADALQIPPYKLLFFDDDPEDTMKASDDRKDTIL